MTTKIDYEKNVQILKNMELDVKNTRSYWYKVIDLDFKPIHDPLKERESRPFMILQAYYKEMAEETAKELGFGCPTVVAESTQTEKIMSNATRPELIGSAITGRME